ncbi:uncharacterized protein PG998_013179 [Apiospora kogelbergensis]|uniref:uncharacterized protein n=1 Tax=Apiospora kogelbergensis TaxID=1337665 RepID=UPI00312EACA5
MACEPCIRGHRTSVCNHGQERVLIAVRKPGRPLRQCPHPPDRSCSCKPQPPLVTAALPRKRKCDCITDAEDPLPDAPESSRPRLSGASPSIPQRPQSPSPSPTRVSLPSSTTASHSATAATTTNAPDAVPDDGGLDIDLYDA